jgi:tRNA A37 threonylcarbamoyladenosine modification protein TsaB
VPGIGFTSLEVLAAAHRPAEQPVAAVIDVRRGEVAWALYQARAAGSPDGARPPAIASPEDLAGALEKLGGPVLAVGDGAERYRSRLEGVPGVTFGGPDASFPSAAVLARSAHRAPAAAGDPRRLAPVYLRPADVRIGWEQAPAGPAAAAVSGGPDGG